MAILLAHIRQHIETIGCPVAHARWTPRLLVNFDQMHPSHRLDSFSALWFFLDFYQPSV
jgi:hypothetical protein